MLYKTINELGNVQNKEMLIPMKTRSKHGHQFCKKEEYKWIQIFILATNHVPIELSAKSISWQ